VPQKKIKRKSRPQGYVHGYDSKEQQRLFQQAKFLEPYIYEKVDFSRQERIVEVGSGVGAQTSIILERFPHLKVDCIDISDAQIAVAKKKLAKYIKQGRVHIHKSDALKLPFEENTFDAAFLCWFLEHVPHPVQVLTEVRRILKSGSYVFCNEVLNSTFFIDPYSPATLQYLFAMNDHQWMLGGDPFVGAKLGNFLLDAGYQSVTTEVRTLHYDNRAPKMRGLMIDYWSNLLVSGSKELIRAKKVTPAIVSEMQKELKSLKSNKDAVFFDAWIQAKGQAF